MRYSFGTCIPFCASRRTAIFCSKEANTLKIETFFFKRECKSICGQVGRYWCLLLIILNSYLSLLSYLMYLQNYYNFLKSFSAQEFPAYNKSV